MPLDAILLTALRRELENSLLGAKIDRISMPEKDVLILSVHSREQGSRRVLLSVRPGSARISFTEQTMENPAQPPMFCMLLRKYLLGARIAALEQPLGERLLLLRLDTVDELNCRGEKTLVLELMGKGIRNESFGEAFPKEHFATLLYSPSGTIAERTDEMMLMPPRKPGPTIRTRVKRNLPHLPSRLPPSMANPPGPPNPVRARSRLNILNNLNNLSLPTRRVNSAK